MQEQLLLTTNQILIKENPLQSNRSWEKYRCGKSFLQSGMMCMKVTLILLLDCQVITRNVSEGGYRRHYETEFNHDNQSLTLTNKLDQTSKNFKTMRGIQDMLSSFYNLRSMDKSKFKVGSNIKMNVWIDDESYPFMLKVVAAEKKQPNLEYFLS